MTLRNISVSEPPIDDADFNLLEWWKHREARWPKLARMVKQYLAAPASTAGVERVFSAAGRMHTDLRKSMQDSTLEHAILAAFNNPGAGVLNISGGNFFGMVSW